VTRVAHVHRIAGVGGSERHLLTLLPALPAHGIDRCLVGLDVPGAPVSPFYAALDAARVPYVRVPAPRDLDPLLAGRVARALRLLGADAVHTHLVHGDVYGTAAAARLRLPVVSTKHNDDPFRAGPFRHVERQLSRRAHRVIAITEALRRFLVARVGLDPGRVVTIPYGLDALPSAWGPNPPLALPDDAQVLLACARLVPQKGLDTAVRALPAIRREHPRAVLVVAGEGPEREALLSLAASLGVGDALLLPGRAGDVAAWYERATLVVHPARWEGFGLVLLEAMLAARAIVASRVSSVPEIVADGETGLLVPPDDAPALTAAVCSLLADDGLRERLGAAGRARARAQFSVAAMVAATAAVYRRAGAQGP
jgi:glycosyltransferase involved in cell wall biosynthesis